jgi:hypothetical protein
MIGGMGKNHERAFCSLPQLATVVLSIGVLGAAACRARTAPGPDGTVEAAADQAMPETPSDDEGSVEPEAALAWQRHELVEQCVGFDLMADVEITSGVYESVHHVAQYTEPIQILVLHGGDISLESWREGFGNWQVSGVSEAEPLVVCGVSARRQTLFEKGVWGEGGFVGPDGKIEFRSISNPDLVRVAVAFEWRGVPYVVVWAVRADKREGNRHNEDHFFGSIRCASEPPGTAG